VQNPKGALMNARAYMWKTFSFKIKLKNAILYHCYGRFAGISAGELWKESPNKLCTLIGFLPGLVLKKNGKSTSNYGYVCVAGITIKERKQELHETLCRNCSII